VGVLLNWAISPLWADLQFTRTKANLGKIRTGVPLVYHFSFTNTGQEPVAIEEVRPGCGCVAPRLRSREVAPGATGTIPMEINTLSQSAGPHRWYVHVYYRQGQEQRQIALELLAEVITEVTVQPATLTIHAAQAVQQEMRLTDLRAQPLRVTALRTTSRYLQAKASERARNEQGHWITLIHLQLSAAFPPGRQEEFLFIDTDDPVYAQLKIPITVDKRSARRISAMPAEVVLDAGLGAALPSRLLLVRDSGEEPVLIAGIKADHPALRCKWAQGPGNAVTVRIQLDRTAVPDSTFRSMIHVIVRQPVACVLDLPVSYRGN
jgi:hypothetical protein